MKHPRRLLHPAVLNWGPAAVLAVLGILAWESLVRVLDVQRWLLPPPSAIAAEIGHSWSLLIRHAGTTAAEILIGLGVSTASGLLLASAMFWSRMLERSVYPFIIASQTIPIFTLAPLLVVWVGTEIASKVVVVVLFTFFPIVVGLMAGLRAVDSEMIAMFRTLGATRWQTFVRLQVPASLPHLLSGMRVAAVVSVIGAVIGEWVGASAGLGWLMKLSGPQFQTARVFAAIVVLSVMALTLFLSVAAAERWLLRNYPGRAGRENVA